MRVVLGFLTIWPSSCPVKREISGGYVQVAYLWDYYRKAVGKSCLRLLAQQYHTPLYSSDMLSEKAKGKQRAIDPELDGEPSRTDSRNLTIRFTEGIPDLVLFVTSKDAVRDVKAKVRVLLQTEACL